jgi:hypothetical protein
MSEANTTNGADKLRADMQAKGYTQAIIWVPADKREKLIKYAAKLRTESEQ